MSEDSDHLEPTTDIDEIMRRFDTLLRGVAAVARGDEQFRADIEAMLPSLEESGWYLSQPIHQIWAGERDLTRLMDGLDLQDTILVKRILELIDQLSPQEVWHSLPAELRLALEAEDVTAANTILDQMPVAEARQIVRQLFESGIVSGAPVAEEVVGDNEDNGELPAAVVAALESENVTALADALAELPPAQARAVVKRLEEAGILAVSGPAPAVDLNQIVRELDPLLHAVAAVAKGDELARAAVEARLVELEESGVTLVEVAQLIWIGERDPALLTADLDLISAQLVERILNLLDSEK
jgi:predicted aconitase with swiveling domain